MGGCSELSLIGKICISLEKAVIHENHEIHERNQKDMKHHGITCLVNYCFAVIVCFSCLFVSFVDPKTVFCFNTYRGENP